MPTVESHFNRDPGEGYPEPEEFEPRDPNYEKRVLEAFRSQGLMRSIGAEMTRLKPGRCEITLPSDDGLTEQHGYFHGGIVATLADVSGGFAAASLLPPGHVNPTVEFKLSLLSPADGDRLVADAVVLRSGRTLKVCRSDVFSIAGDGSRDPCATAIGTYMTTDWD